jgi:hypothetical protein
MTISLSWRILFFFGNEWEKKITKENALSFVVSRWKWTTTSTTTTTTSREERRDYWKSINKRYWKWLVFCRHQELWVAMMIFAHSLQYEHRQRHNTDFQTKAKQDDSRR